MEATDPYAFDIQLNTKDDGREYHRKNEGNEIQRPNVVDDLCGGLLLRARIDRIVHGHEKNGKGHATLVVFGFRFHGLDERRRFKEARIMVTFAGAKTGKKPRIGAKDPEVIGLWPNGDFALGAPTDVEVDATQGFDIGAEVTGGPTLVQTGGHATWKWEKRKRFMKTDLTRLTGSTMLDMDVREYGNDNAVRLTVTENRTTGSGLVTDFRAVVLLRRFSEADTFSAVVKVEASAHFAYNMVHGVRDLLGLSPAQSPVVFQPGVQYLRPPTLAGWLEERLESAVDEDNLNSHKLDVMAGVLGTTAIAV